MQGLSTDFSPPAPVDVLISDIRGGLPLFRHHIATIADARDRLFRPGGVQLPQGDVIRVALVEAPEEHDRLTRPWGEAFLGLDLRRGLAFVTNTMSRPRIMPEALLSAPQDVITLDYRSIAAANARGEVVLQAQRPGQAHGLAIWFDAQVDGENGYSNAPGEPPLVYGHSFMPFDLPFALEEGDRVSVEIRADLIGGEYEWGWSGQHLPASTDSPGRRFRQSTMRGHLFDPTQLAPRAAHFHPEPGEDVQIARAVLARIDGRTSNAQIAEAIAAEFPERFPDAARALDRVAGIVARHAAPKNGFLS